MTSHARPILCLCIATGLMASACGRKNFTEVSTAKKNDAPPVSIASQETLATAAAPPPPQTGDDAAPALPPTNPSGTVSKTTLEAITTSLRRFVEKNGRPPKELSDLVKLGYLKELPPPPPGKKYVWDPYYWVSLEKQ